MGASDLRLRVLGTRGSLAISGEDYREFGGNTSCYMVQAGEETIFLDAGSGIFSAPDRFSRPPVILLSHLHLDHVIGLGMFPAISRKGQRISIHVPFCRDAQEACEQLDRLYAPPFWPVKLREMGAEPEILPVPEHFCIGEVRVETMAGSHPGGSIVYKLRYAGRTLVYATDYEHSDASDAALAAFARGADLLLYDAQFEPREYERKKGFGHSTAEKGRALMESAEIRRMLLIHHDPKSTDDLLRRREALLPTDRVSMAREGQVIVL